jgi:beta-N-acetylhexosaminidase
MAPKRFLSVLLLVSILCGSLFFPGSTVDAAASLAQKTPADKAQDLFSKLTPEEKVGQLFLVTFKGTNISSNSQIYDLIANSHVGGVVLWSANDNFTQEDGTVDQIAGLTNGLQDIGWNLYQKAVASGLSTAEQPVYIPLLIGVSQEGDGSPNDQILNALAPLPNEMSIGATWDTTMANKVGSALGQELQSMGLNLLLGPSLDVLEVPIAEGGEDLGTRTFGGDPFWVGEMGKAYISGVHDGSENRMMVVSKHFPGRGSSDRLPEEEVATVRKSLEQLKQIELAPFMAVTGSSTNTPSQTDGLLVSHIRYQGFQGNIRATTRPVSFDSSALSLLMSLPEFSTWRDAGGIIVSDDLGSQAVRKFNDPTGKNFDSKQVARNAFLAGNDILYMDNFQGVGDADSYTSIVRTIQSFTQKYNEDSSFAQRVDASVLRILTQKFKLYPEFTLDRVTPIPANANLKSQIQQTSLEVAQKSVTLINPDSSELASLLPKPPVKDERIVFITDTMTSRQCSTCTDVTTPAVDALQNAVLKYYGPLAGGQVQQSRLSSFSFTDLENWLTSTDGKQTAIQIAINQADWVVFAPLNLDKNRASSQALRHLLTMKPESIRNKKTVVFALNGPYYLDATDISKLTAYYGIYSKISTFIDIAVRVLFQEITPQGASPISIPGVGYDLTSATSPDPKQIIPLFLDMAEAPGTAGTATPEPTAIPKFNVGDTLPIKSGVIYDQNHKPVPDGTVAHFVITTGGGEKGVTSQTEATTTGGIVRLAYRIESSGLLEIRATCDPATASDILQLDITGKESAAVTSIAPTPMPTETPLNPEPSPTIEPTATPVPTPVKTTPDFWEWLLTILIIGTAVSVVFSLGVRLHSSRWGFRWALTTIIGGMLFYLYLALGLPGSSILVEKGSTAGILGIVILGMGLGWLGGYLWLRLEKKDNPFHT